jgi:hypothetical protein
MALPNLLREDSTKPSGLPVPLPLLLPTNPFASRSDLPLCCPTENGMQQEWLRKPDGNRQLVQLFPDDINAGKELFHGLSIRDALLPS